MSIGMRSKDREREIEIAVVRTFGFSVIEFEAVLFQKFLVMSATSSLMTEDMFRKHLKNMEAKGYIAPVDFQNKRVWKRLVIESDIDEETLTPEEVRAFFEKARTLENKKTNLKKPEGEKTVSESRVLAENILRYLEMGMPTRIKVKRRLGEPTLIDHVEAMHHALADSKNDFLKYVRKNLPRVYEDMEKLLNSKGEEVVLRSLRMIESGQRIYPPQ
ncbi:MAG: hypothetical protein E4H14_10765 [Candidatus Thorarchaeota archaeon]|nr:MAG: hypothetical protein E4H14_10765 [Candidatus Thorarchaeota archaeon]